ncbi:hypothetical protein FOXG_18158 [Fusarium oxysporum f. sp. lycopersici 4287]|uniref:Uncharacterized protein n=2 Tax=Fusarium oxysporum TaxID=5507 RepID=A0A0J9UC96_FUSO4|nr:hypothetical protein FOXG_18158 [Fusarium oxysporum f. sp. lycopersici 4287]EXK42642.1 hypothetical protein FOMG_05474 [Fusarium oxysporum f. sp. melonis 26406]KNA96472.1 hypothetical protein FOXG_18158 [Fusarium oxysporum f. sp. lycopersici 4287]
MQEHVQRSGYNKPLLPVSFLGGDDRRISNPLQTSSSTCRSDMIVSPRRTPFSHLTLFASCNNSAWSREVGITCATAGVSAVPDRSMPNHESSDAHPAWMRFKTLPEWHFHQ